MHGNTAILDANSVRRAFDSLRTNHRTLAGIDVHTNENCDRNAIAFVYRDTNGDLHAVSYPLANLNTDANDRRSANPDTDANTA